MIRKLGKTESLISHRGRKFSRSLRVTTDLDLFSRASLLNQIIRQWMSLHPLLRAKIERIDEASYFVLDQSTDSDDDWMENVKYLSIQPGSEPEKVFDDVSWLLCEKELGSGYCNRLLWSLVILELCKESTIAKEYEIILTMNHTISEGRNSHVLLLQLLDLIEYNWFLDRSPSVRNPLKEYQVVPSVDELYFDNFDQSAQTRRASVLKPGFINPAEAQKNPTKFYDWSDRLAKDWIYETSSKGKRPYIQLGHLAKASQKICFKSRRLTFSKNVKTKLVSRCKQEKCSVTCLLANVAALSLRQLDTQPDRIVPLIPISLRQFNPTDKFSKQSKEFQDQITMGYYGSALRLSKRSVELAEESIWLDSRADTKSLREMIERKEMFLEDRPRSPSERGASFVLSNLGVVPARLAHPISPQQQFNIKQAFTEQEIDPEDYNLIGPLSLHVSTCNGCLHVSFLYNSFVFSHSRLDLFLRNFLDYLKKLLEKN